MFRTGRYPGDDRLFDADEIQFLLELIEKIVVVEKLRDHEVSAMVHFPFQIFQVIHFVYGIDMPFRIAGSSD